MQPSKATAILETHDLSVYYGSKIGVSEINIGIPNNSVTAIIGPSGCGKSTLLRAMNRMNEFVPSVVTTGQIKYNNQDIYAPDIDATEVRRQIGMVFQKPNPFPQSIYHNIAWGPRLHDTKDNLDSLVEESLVAANLWPEVRDRLHEPATTLSGGQQQRLCIARALAMRPKLLLMDEPCSALDPISTQAIEQLIHNLKSHISIVIVTHNLQQAQRISDYVTFMHLGECLEFGTATQMFHSPSSEKAAAYISGEFG